MELALKTNQETSFWGMERRERWRGAHSQQLWPWGGSEVSVRRGSPTVENLKETGVIITFMLLFSCQGVSNFWCNPMDCSPPGLSVHEISQTRILSGLPFPSPEDLPNLGIKLTSPMSPAQQAIFHLLSIASFFKSQDLHCAQLFFFLIRNHLTCP